MTSLQEADQITYSFLFTITPLEILSTKSIKNLKKSLLLKLGDRTQKTSELNKPMEIPVDVLYSKTLKKYCPIKGIIKVYDINLDGSEVISSVGGFQTEEILNQQKNNVIIERDVGTSKIKMKIEIKNLGTAKGKSENPSQQESVKNQQAKKQQYKYPLARSRTRQSTQEAETNPLQKSRIIQSNVQKPQYCQEEENKKEKPIQHFRRSTPMAGVSSLESTKFIDSKKIEALGFKKEGKNISESNDKTLNTKKVDEFTEKSSKLIQGKGQQISLTQKNLKTPNVNVNEQSEDQLKTLKQLLKKGEQERQALMVHFEKVINGLQTKNGKIWMENNEKEKGLTLKFKQRGFERIFHAFLEFIIFELSRPKDNTIFTEPQQKLSSIEAKLQRQIQQLTQQLSRNTNQIFTLRARQRQKALSDPKIKSQQLSELQSNLKELDSINKTLKQENDYLKQKDQTMQQIITEKQNQIENLKQQITQIDLEFKEMECTIKNDACEIQELKEEVSNLNEVIESYREKYGDLKNVKNRALQNQLKECLIWIDQQTRELQMSDFAEDTEPSHSHNVSEIIKNIELQGASREEMNSIKIELAGLIRRIDNFLAK